MKRSELVDEVAQRTGLLAADVSMMVDALRDVIVASIRNGDKVVLPGFLTVERVHRAPRQGRNPRTGEALTVPARFGVKLTAGQALKSAAKSGDAG